jgi:hypothetical protein
MPRSTTSQSRNGQSGPFSSALKWKPSHTYLSPKSPISPLPKTTPPPSQSLPIQHHSLQVQQPGFFSNMWQGFGLGAGQSIAFNMFRSDPVVKHVHESTALQLPVATDTLPKEYVQCMKESQNNAEACKQYLEQVETKLK